MIPVSIGTLNIVQQFGSIISLIASCKPKSCKSISLWSNNFNQTTLWIANFQTSDFQGWESTQQDLNITFERTHQISSTFCILRFFIKLMSEIFRYFHVRGQYVLCSFHTFKQHRGPWLKPKRCGKSRNVSKTIEINLHIKAYTGHYFYFQRSRFHLFDTSF